MHYHGTDKQELADLVQYETEPVLIFNSILEPQDVEDMSFFHGWVFEPVWYLTEVLSWGPNSVSSRTTQHQRLVPPADWVPVPRPEPVDPEPVDPEPTDPEPEDQDPSQP